MTTPDVLRLIGGLLIIIGVGGIGYVCGVYQGIKNTLPQLRRMGMVKEPEKKKETTK